MYVACSDNSFFYNITYTVHIIKCLMYAYLYMEHIYVLLSILKCCKMQMGHIIFFELSYVYSPTSKSVHCLIDGLIVKSCFFLLSALAGRSKTLM